MKVLRLNEIDIIRTWVIIGLVAYHAFAPYTGSWEMPGSELQSIPLYNWLGKLFYSGMLETFVFISGYVFALGDNKHHYELSDLFRKKIKRLYIPCLVFGVLYVLVLQDWWNLLNVDCWIAIVNGIGHLWFLPMLLGCFLLEKIWLKYVGLRYWWGLLLIALLPIPTLPANFNSSFYYLFFFHIGYLFFLYREKFILLIKSNRGILPGLAIVYLIVFYGLTLVQIQFQITSDLSIIEKIEFMFMGRLAKLILSSYAVIVYYALGSLSASFIKDKSMEVYRYFAKYSFAIYIFQQIILIFLYYHTLYCNSVGNYYIPLGG